MRISEDVESQNLSTRRGEDLSPAQFQHLGYRTIDLMVDLLFSSSKPLMPSVSPGDVSRTLQTLPLVASPDMILQDIEELIIPTTLRFNDPRFFGYVGLPGSAISVLADLVDSALGTTRTQWHMSPSGTELEQYTLDLLREWLGVPGPLFGMIHHNSAVLAALVAARCRLGPPAHAPLMIYITEETHSSVLKAARVMNLHVNVIETTLLHKMDINALSEAIDEDIASGGYPLAVIGTIGTTSVGSIDPIPQLADLCERYKLWLHIDGAFGIAAALLPEMRAIIDGLDRADSWTVNPHKWLRVTTPCSVLYTRHPEALRAAFSQDAAYLADKQQAVVNLSDYSLTLPHRNPALKLWAVMRYFGQEGLAAGIRGNLQQAQRLGLWIETSWDFERLAPVYLNVICFRAPVKGADEQVDETLTEQFNQRLLHRVNAAGRFYLSSTRVEDRYALRICFSNPATTEEDVRRFWEELQTAFHQEREGLLC